MAAAAAHALTNLPSTTKLVSQFEEKTKSFSKFHSLSTHNLQNPWLGINLCLRRSNQGRVFLKNPCVVASVSHSLPNAKPEGAVTSDRTSTWSINAIRSFGFSEIEARKMKYLNTGTECLLMGIMIEGSSLASLFLRANGITLFKVREECIKLQGKGGPWNTCGEHPPLTEDLKKALDWAVDKKQKSGENGEVTSGHLLLGIWSQVESPGHKILANLGFNEEKAKELESFIADCGDVYG